MSSIHAQIVMNKLPFPLDVSRIIFDKSRMLRRADGRAQLKNRILALDIKLHYSLSMWEIFLCDEDGDECEISEDACTIWMSTRIPSQKCVITSITTIDIRDEIDEYTYEYDYETNQYVYSDEHFNYYFFNGRYRRVPITNDPIHYPEEWPYSQNYYNNTQAPPRPPSNIIATILRHTKGE
jgi:hypothetical protein